MFKCLLRLLAHLRRVSDRYAREGAKVITSLYLLTLMKAYTLLQYYLTREWHVERVKLIHCIYLQQMELTERAVAAQEKASEIAKVNFVAVFITIL